MKVLKLLQSIPLKHDEKRERRRHAFETQNMKHWSKIKAKTIGLRKTVQAEVKQCVREARGLLKTTHSEILKQPKCVKSCQRIKVIYYSGFVILDRAPGGSSAWQSFRVSAEPIEPS